MTNTRYLEAGPMGNRINRLFAWLPAHGIGVSGARILSVRGRKSGEPRTVPVFPLTHDGDRYLVAPRGHTQWVRNLRVAGTGELKLGKRTEAFTATELDDADKPAVLRAYLTKWKSLDKAFFDGLGDDASDERLLEVAPGYPVFRLTTTD